MARPTSSSKKKGLPLKPRHRRSLRNLSKLFHGLGVNIREHIETLELDEEELNDIRREFGAEAFLGPRDRTLLKDAISNLMSVMKATVVLEELLWNQVAPHVFAAYSKKLLSHSLIELRAIREIYKSLYHRRTAGLKAELPRIRQSLLISFANEEKFIFKKYPRLLRAIRENLEDLLEIEAREEKVFPKLRGEFLRRMGQVCQLLREDVSFLTKDIAKLYDVRIEVCKWLIEADKAAHPRILPALEKECTDMRAASSYYINNYRAHLKNVSEIYLRRGEKG